MRKTIVFIVLGIPVLIAVILKFFGESQYEIPIYYEDGVVNLECGIQTTDQYYLQSLHDGDNDILSFREATTILFIQSELNNPSVQIDQQIARMMSTKTSSNELRICVLTNDQSMLNISSDYLVLEYDIESLRQVVNCELLVSSSEIAEEEIGYNTVILIDDSGRIRGYYDGTEEEEFDRLSAEVDILLTEKK